MRKNSLLGAAVASLALMAGTAGQAQPYSNAVMALNPAAYWPLNETNIPPQPINAVATNMGTLGAAGNGYYGAWYQASSNTWYITNNIAQTNGITFANDGGKALWCQSQPGQYVIVPRNTNGVANPAVTIVPPFSVEAWALIGATNSANRTLVSQGQVPVNIGGPDPTNPFYGGPTTGWAGFALGQYQDYFYFSCYCTNAVNNKTSELDSSSWNKWTGFRPGQWLHVVATFDGATEQLWTNGVMAGSKNVAANGAGLKYVPDPTSPLMIGNGNVVCVTAGQQPFSGALDEVAIYPSVLSSNSIQNHYQTAYGTNAIYGAVYTNAVLADIPMLYYRLDELQGALNAGYPSGTFPTANNHGSLGAAANGVYQPGTTPGVSGPPYGGFGTDSRGVAINGWFGAVDIGGGNLPPELNPTNKQPLTVVTWFQSGPADSPGRFQEILGHGDNSYRLAMGQYADNHFNPGFPSSGELQFTNFQDVAGSSFALNDGKWHMVAGVFDGTNESLYLDGALAKSGTISVNSNVVGSAVDLLLGGDSQYTYASAGSANTIRNFDGRIAQAAFWTNALSGPQIQQLYSSAGNIPPIIHRQPVSAINNVGQNVTLATIVSGTSPLYYQWYKNDSPYGAPTTSSSLVFNPAALNNSGSYYMIVTNLYGAATSQVAQVTIYGPPVVSQQSPTNVLVFANTAPLLRVTANGPGPISYQWTRNGSPISGATGSAYAPSTATLGASTYTCQITNIYSTNVLSAFSAITVTVLPRPTAPYPVAVLGDGPANYFRLNEAADPLNPFSNGMIAYDYAGAMNAVYTNTYLGWPGYTSGFQPQTDPDETAPSFGNGFTANSYVGNGSAFLDFAAPAGSNAQFSVEAWINSSLAPQSDAGIVTLGYGYGGEQFNLDCGARVGASNDRALRFYVNDASGTTHRAASTNASILSDNRWHHIVGVCDEANSNVCIYVDGILHSTGTITPGAGLHSLPTNPPSPPLSIGARQPSGTYTSYTNQFIGNINDVAIYNYALNSTQVLSHYVAAGIAPTVIQQPPLSVTVNEHGTITITAVAVGTAPLAYQWYLNGAEVPGATTATLSLTNVDISLNGGGAYVIVTNLYGSVLSSPCYFTVNGGPPNITADLQPPFATNYAGKPFTYSVAVDGTAPFHYQWYRNGAAISGATNPSYTFAVVQGVSSYSVTITNAYGSATSTTVTNVGAPALVLNPLYYTYKMKITFPGYNRGEPLQNFPALVTLGTNLPSFAYAQLASPTGGDLRFTDASGTNQIPHEIDEWNPNGVSTIWVAVPTLSSTNDFIWAYWGNPAAPTPEAWSTNGEVWVPRFDPSAPFKVVYHLKESAFPFADSTLVYPALSGTAPTPTAGVVGTGASFTGSQFLDVGVVTNLDDVLTLSTWVNIDPSASSIQTIWANQPGGYGSPGFAWFVNYYNTANQDLRFASGNGDGTSTGGREVGTPNGAVTFGQWHLLTAVINRTNGVSSGSSYGTVEFYVDGNDLGSGQVVTNFPVNVDLNLGRFTNGSFPFHGVIDEARIQAGTNSLNWVWASYMTVAQNASFESYAAIISSAVTLKYQVSGGNLILTWEQGTLQSASQVTGTYSDIPSATSPHTVPLSAAKQFYRVKVR